MRIASLQSSLDDTSHSRKEINQAVAYILSEGSFAEQCIFDKYTPGNSSTMWGVKFDSPFKEFKHDTSGMLRSTGKTCVSWMVGKINGKTVVFVHPTSNVVDYEEIQKCLKSIKDIPIIEADINFLGTLRDKVPEIFK